ncbi:MAG: hypothetical protein MN733_32645 [Nitrososphaera sp.]|nr:hypothetical protein [Nitrososphaera sp.]
MVEIAGEYGFWLALATVIVESIIVVLLYRTVRDYAEVAKLSRIEAKHRFRPWVGPVGGIEFLREENGKYQYSVTIKNYGEIPASSVMGMSAARSESPSRDMIASDSLDKFNLGPLLPFMEKRYWIFIDSAAMENAKKGSHSMFAVVYFLYEFPAGGKSGYGMISQFDPKSNTFLHKDMWVDQDAFSKNLIS